MLRTKLRIFKPEYLIFLLILGLAFYIAYIPHIDYPYPVHLDEWTHLACSNQIIEQASLTDLASPFSGEEPVSNQSLELGFHLFWTVFHQISGISWLAVFRYFPSVILIINVLAVFILAQRQKFGWQAAFFTCLIPTTAGILGPAFLVPVSMGLVFIPLSLILVFYFRSTWSYLVLLIFVVFLLSLHPATAVGFAIILAPYILLNLRSDFRHSLKILLALAIPFLAS
ncbi:MAG: hypothetical protein PHV60_10260, partial [bacterium]|nr:hypothetical protein [bacterium]